MKKFSMLSLVVALVLSAATVQAGELEALNAKSDAIDAAGAMVDAIGEAYDSYGYADELRDQCAVARGDCEDLDLLAEGDDYRDDGDSAMSWAAAWDLVAVLSRGIAIDHQENGNAHLAAEEWDLAVTDYGYAEGEYNSAITNWETAMDYWDVAIDNYSYALEAYEDGSWEE